MSRLWRDASVWICLVAIVASMTVVFRHVDFRQTYHTGFEPYDLVVLYALMIAFGAIRLRMKPERRRLTAVMMGLALASGATVVWLDDHDVIVQYDRWVKRGMPEVPFQR